MTTTTYYETETIWIREPVYMLSGSAATSADVTNYSVQVFDVTAPTQTLYIATSQSPANHVLATFQTSGGWTRDDVGYNFQLSLPSSTFTRTGGHVYRVEIILNTSADGPKYVVNDVNIKVTL